MHNSGQQTEKKFEFTKMQFFLKFRLLFVNVDIEIFKLLNSVPLLYNSPFTCTVTGIMYHHFLSVLNKTYQITGVRQNLGKPECTWPVWLSIPRQLTRQVVMVTQRFESIIFQRQETITRLMALSDCQWRRLRPRPRPIISIQNSMGICLVVCLCAMCTPSHNPILIFYQSWSRALTV